MQPFGIHSHQFDIKEEGIHADIRRRTVAHRCRTLLDSPWCVAATFAAPCNTTSVSRLFNTHDGPPVLFTAAEPDGKKGLGSKAYAEMADARRTFDACGDLVCHAHARGRLIFGEGPAARHDPAALEGRLWDKSGITGQHGSFWTTRAGIRIASLPGISKLECAYCSLDGNATLVPALAQKYTSLVYSTECEDVVGGLRHCLCRHAPGAHPAMGGQDEHRRWRMAGLARWPPQIAARYALSTVAAVYPWLRSTITERLLPTAPPAPSIGNLHAYGVPLLEFKLRAAHAHVFLPVCFDGVVGRIGIPSGSREQLFGTERQFDSREADSSTARRWSDALFAPRTDIFTYWLMRSSTGRNAELSVTSALVCAPPPQGLERHRADVPDQRASTTGPSVVWATPDAFVDPDLYSLAHAAIQVARQMSEPTPELRTVDFETGAMSLHPVTHDRVVVHADLPALDWEVVCKEGQQTIMSCNMSSNVSLLSPTRRTMSLPNAGSGPTAAAHPPWLTSRSSCAPPATQRLIPGWRTCHFRTTPYPCPPSPWHRCPRP